jgi:hypothetical protein
MAKLHAHGRQELARVERVDRPNTELVLWTRHTRVLMDDGVVLNKMDTKWKGSPNTEYGRWRVSGQLNIRKTTPATWLKAQAAVGYRPGHKRHSWAQVTVDTMSDAEVNEQLRRLR